MPHTDMPQTAAVPALIGLSAGPNDLPPDSLPQPDPDTFPDPMPDPEPIPVQDPELPPDGEVVPPIQA